MCNIFGGFKVVFKVLINPTSFTALVILCTCRSVIYFVVFGTFFTSLQATKEGKTVNGLIQKRAPDGGEWV